MTSTPPRTQESLPSADHGGDRERLEEALSLLADRQAQFTETFYARFFARHPEVVPLFGEHAHSEREEMMNETLNSLLGWCEGQPWLADNLAAMGASHWEYGVTGEMYGAFASVFLDVVREQLAGSWNGELAIVLPSALRDVTEAMRLAGDRAAERARQRRRRAVKADQ